MVWFSLPRSLCRCRSCSLRHSLPPTTETPHSASSHAERKQASRHDMLHRCHPSGTRLQVPQIYVNGVAASLSVRNSASLPRKITLVLFAIINGVNMVARSTPATLNVMRAVFAIALSSIRRRNLNTFLEVCVSSKTRVDTWTIDSGVLKHHPTARFLLTPAGLFETTTSFEPVSFAVEHPQW